MYLPGAYLTLLDVDAYVEKGAGPGSLTGPANVETSFDVRKREKRDEVEGDRDRGGGGETGRLVLECGLARFVV